MRRDAITQEYNPGDSSSTLGGFVMQTKYSSWCVAAAAAMVAGLAQAAEPAVPYPTGYRSWQHVKSMVILEGHALHGSFGGIHHLYANPKALAGYRSGKFPDGAVLVFDLLEGAPKDNAISEGARKVVGVMRKDSKRFAATGGWGYEGFGGDSKTTRVVGANAATACHACHQAQKDKDFVFSAMRP